MIIDYYVYATRTNLGSSIQLVLLNISAQSLYMQHQITYRGNDYNLRMNTCHAVWGMCYTTCTISLYSHLLLFVAMKSVKNISSSAQKAILSYEL